MKTIQEFLPVKSKDTSLIQGRVPTEIVSDARKIMDRDDISWSELLTACLKYFIEEKRKK